MTRFSRSAWCVSLPEHAARAPATPSLSYDDLLHVFWGKHDPTQLNRQSGDVGDRYRSAIIFHDEEQQEAAVRSKAEEQAGHALPVVTQIEPRRPASSNSRR